MTSPSTNAKGRQPLLNFSALQELWGGDVPFWLAVVWGDLDPETMAWLREQSDHDEEIAWDLESVEHSAGDGSFTSAHAQRHIRQALQASSWLVQDETPQESNLLNRPGKGVTAADYHDDVTGFVLTSMNEEASHAAEIRHQLEEVFSPYIGGPPAELRRWMAESLFPLLALADIEIPPDQQASAATQLLHQVAGPEAVRSFRLCARWIDRIRRRAAEPHPQALTRILLALAPKVFFQAQPGVYGFRPSFRLFLRDRLKTFSLQQGWLDASQPEVVEEAFANLTRQRIGEVLQEAVGYLCDHAPHEGVRQTWSQTKTIFAEEAAVEN